MANTEPGVWTGDNFLWESIRERLDTTEWIEVVSVM